MPYNVCSHDQKKKFQSNQKDKVHAVPMSAMHRYIYGHSNDSNSSSDHYFANVDEATQNIANYKASIPTMKIYNQRQTNFKSSLHLH